MKDEPIVCTPEDAYRRFVKTQIDVLVLESYLIAKPAATLADVAGRAALRSA